MSERLHFVDACKSEHFEAMSLIHALGWRDAPHGTGRAGTPPFYLLGASELPRHQGFGLRAKTLERATWRGVSHHGTGRAGTPPFYLLGASELPRHQGFGLRAKTLERATWRGVSHHPGTWM